MAELDQPSISSPNSIVPFKLTSEQQIAGPSTTAHNLDFALLDRGSANTERADHHKIKLSASKKLVQSDSKLHDSRKLQDGIDSREDKHVIGGQLASLISLHNYAQVERELCRPMKKLKWEGKSNSPQGEGEGEEEESGCVTPTAREQRIPREIFICPPPPCKKRHNCKRKSTDAMPPCASSSTPQYLVVSPPDLHTFPHSIRALFFHSY